MTLPIASIPLTYDGTSLQSSDLQIYLQITRGLNESPSVRGVDVTVPALAGRVEANRINDVLSIVLEGHVTADPADLTTATARDSYRTNVMAVRALFATNRARADLVATLEDGSTATISARPLNLLWGESVQSEYATVNIELEGYGDWVVVP